MASVVAIGEAALVRGFALGGARVVVAEEAADVRGALAAAGDAAVVILTPRAAAVGRIEDVPVRPGSPLVVVIPA